MREREFVESPAAQGADESIVYALDTSRWGNDPTSPVVKVYDEAGTDVSASKLTGSASISDNTIILPALHSLAAGTEYRVEVKFVIGGNTVECYGFIRGEA